MGLTDQEITVAVTSIYRDEDLRRRGMPPMLGEFGIPMRHMKYGFIPYRPARTVVTPSRNNVLPMNDAQRAVFEIE